MGCVVATDARSGTLDFSWMNMETAQVQATPNLYFRRSDRTQILFQGRSPGKMLTGLVTGTVGPDPVPLAGADSATGWHESAVYESLVLTPKGRIVTDLRLARLEPGETGAFFADLPRAGEAGLTEHLKRYLPPRLARGESCADVLSMVTVVGPDAFSLTAALFSEHSSEILSGLTREVSTEGGVAAVPALIRGTSAVEGDQVLLFPSNAVAGPAVDLVASESRLAAWVALLQAQDGVGEGTQDLWTALRVAHGLPETGAELDEGVLPPEAGLERRAIDHQKGCYTGQEVIVRIRDRGHVNRHLRHLVVPSGVVPVVGATVHRLEDGKEVGVVKTAVRIPHQSEALAFAYIRREIQPGDRVTIAQGADLLAEVRALSHPPA